MKVLNVKTATTFYVDTDVEEFGGSFRRGENGGWEQLMGESWETCYSREEELEAAFQKFMHHGNATKQPSQQEEKKCEHTYKCTYDGMDGERYRCSKCGNSYYLDYDEMR